MYYFSKSTNGFYVKEIHGSVMPQDSVEITAKDYNELLQGQTLGMMITSDDSGYPILKKKEISFDELKEMEKAWITSELDRARDELEKVQDGDSSAKGTVTQWREYRKALRALPDHVDFPNISARPLAPDI